MKKNYDGNFYSAEKKDSKSSSDILFSYICERLKCKTIIDFGCGVGEWLKTAKNYTYVKKVLGCDGEWAREYLEIDQDEFYGCDLTQEIDLKEKYDLAISLEVAEHLPKGCAKIFIGNLVRHADVVLFSAAIPYQGGTYHVNEQYPSYWEKIFSDFGFSICDCIRSQFWNDETIKAFYRQNIFLYCKNELQCKILESFKQEKKIIDIVHPYYWENRNSHSCIFPFDEIKHNEKIVIYGAGKVGKIFVNQLLATDYAKIVLWCDRSFEDYGSDVSTPLEIKEVQFDHVIIATEKEKTASEIRDDLVKMGVPNKHILWKMPVYKNRY